MTRRTLLSVLLSREPDLQSRILAFEEPWGQFVRKYFGCRPEGEMNNETCRPHRASIDRTAFERARKAAKELFNFKE